MAQRAAEHVRQYTQRAEREAADEDASLVVRQEPPFPPSLLLVPLLLAWVARQMHPFPAAAEFSGSLECSEVQSKPFYGFVKTEKMAYRLGALLSPGVLALALVFTLKSSQSVVCASSSSSPPAARASALKEVAGDAAAAPTRLYSPAALPLERRKAALHLFERVHPTLTIHYSGFSRSGSLVCYDMLNELRTVEEATALMDVEFHLLDLMLEHYKVGKHMRVVDANIVKQMLDLGSLFSFRFPEAVSRVTRFIKDYDPILRVFLKRYLPHIEYLIVVNVPTLFVPFLPSIAGRIMGIPAGKLVALSSGEGLERYMDKKYIPREFGNPQGVSVKGNEQDITATCLMLQEIKNYLGEGALTPEGKVTLDRHGSRLLGRTQEPLAPALEAATAAAVEEEEPFDDID
ncbi:hypothetical protein Efla_002919 [Eimeria flavescens]